MRIKKTKYKEGRMFIQYQKKNSKGSYDDFTLECEDAPRPEYEKIIDKLAPHMVEICEFPSDYNSRMTVRSISFSYGGESEIMGCVMSGLLRLKKNNAPMIINTPHKTSEHYTAKGDDVILLSEKCVDLLIDLQKECELYIKGERAQGDLFKGEKNKDVSKKGE